MSTRARILKGEELASVKRKIDLVLSVAGEGDMQVSVLIHALAYLAINERLEMASVVHGLTDAYLRSSRADDDDDDDDDDAFNYDDFFED